MESLWICLNTLYAKNRLSTINFKRYLRKFTKLKYFLSLVDYPHLDYISIPDSL
jgi:hypothetical protein